MSESKYSRKALHNLFIALGCQLYNRCKAILFPFSCRETLAVQFFIYSYVIFILLGSLLLQLPFCLHGSISWLDTFFTASSAVSTTGLSVIDIEMTFSFWGQLILLLLVQLGGIGYMLFSLFVVFEHNLLNSHKAPQDAPKTTFDLILLIKKVFLYTCMFELVGACILYQLFLNIGIENPLWLSIFYSISAFCTAGFSITSYPLETHGTISLILSVLSLIGSFGFFFWTDLFKEAFHPKKISLIASKRIARSFVTTTILLGTFIFFVLATLSLEGTHYQKFILSFFQITTTLTTAGFNTIDLKTLSQSVQVFIIIFMLLGVTLTGNGVNLRGTSFFDYTKVMIYRLFNKKITPTWTQKILLRRTQIILSTFLLYLVFLVLSTLALMFLENQSFLPLLFETASALTTVGLSIGVMDEMSNLGKILIAVLMIVGRNSILISGFLHSTRKLWKDHEPEEISYIEAKLEISLHHKS